MAVSRIYVEHDKSADGGPGLNWGTNCLVTWHMACASLNLGVSICKMPGGGLEAIPFKDSQGLESC